MRVAGPSVHPGCGPPKDGLIVEVPAMHACSLQTRELHVVVGGPGEFQVETAR
jgi:hypothetical protein